MRFRSLRVLLVEDDPRMAEVAANFLRNAGFAVDVAADAAGALERAALNPYDAVVLDLGLPEVDGFEVCRRLRARNRALPIIMATARDSIDDRVTGLDLGADDYLVKPCALAEPVARLRALRRRPAESIPTTLELSDHAWDANYDPFSNVTDITARACDARSASRVSHPAQRDSVPSWAQGAASARRRSIAGDNHAARNPASPDGVVRGSDTGVPPRRRARVARRDAPDARTLGGSRASRSPRRPGSIRGRSGFSGSFPRW